MTFYLKYIFCHIYGLRCLYERMAFPERSKHAILSSQAHLCYCAKIYLRYLFWPNVLARAWLGKYIMSHRCFNLGNRNIILHLISLVTQHP